ncbi:MAG TPA: pyridoxamine 5'-phosphate oxidase family protein [Candidatus Angelobacter sp.]|nr:pyridoxamine 5'-phosphate oxidase family protein [Candidatus Angelobacter sp.]
MFETDAETAELQQLIDRTMRTANPHMRSIVSPERRLTARQVTTYLQGTKHVVFATIDEDEPRASPLDALFIHGRFTMSTGRRAAKVRHLRANPACSAVHMDGDRVAVVVNGRVEWLERDHPDHDVVHRAWTAQYGSDPYTWGDVVFFRVQPVTMWAYASDPSQFPEAP